MKGQDDQRWGYLLVNLATLFWAGNIAVGRSLREAITPFGMVAIRASLAAIIYALLLATLYRNQLPDRQQGNRRQWLLYLGMAITGVYLYPVMMYLALRYTTAIHAALINATGPLVTMLLAALLLKEAITARLIVGSLISLLGVWLIISHGDWSSLFSQGFNHGDGILLAIIFLWGLYSVWSRVATRNRSSLWVTSASTWLALPLLIPSAAWEWQRTPMTFTLPLAIACLYIGIFPTVISFLCWNESIRRLGPNRAMAFYNTLALYGSLLGVVFLRETLTWALVLGGALVVGGGLTAGLPAGSSTPAKAIATDKDAFDCWSEQ